MQRLDQTRRVITDQLSRVSSTARLLIGALVVIVVLSLFLVGALAGRPSMVPLRVHPDARPAVLAHLESSGIPYREQGGEVLVPADRQHAILGRLTDQEVISGEQIDFERLIDQGSPFLTREQNDRRWLIAKMNVLSSLVGRFRGIERATVVLDPATRVGLGSAHIPPTASVHVVPAGELSAAQVEAIADLVAGSTAGLRPRNVQIVDARSGRSYRPRNDEEVLGSRYLEIKQHHEQLVAAKLRELLGYIPQVRIAVNAMVDNARVQRQSSTSEDPRTGPVQQTRELGDARVENPGGYPVKINATISVPRSYFVGKFRQDRNDPRAVPDDTALSSVVDAETARIKRAVEPLIDTVALENAVLGTVVVDLIPDALPPAPAAEAAAPAAPPAGLGDVSFDAGLLRRLGLGALALLAMALMLLMVRRASRGGMPSSAAMTGSAPPRSGLGGAAAAERPSEVTRGCGELDEQARRRRQMLDQIASMVSENPDEAAGLMRRWITVPEP